MKSFLQRSRVLWLIVGSTVCGVICGPAIRAWGTPPLLTASASSSPSSITHQSSGLLTIHFKIARGFHVNANKPLDPSLIPTEVQLTGAKGIQYGRPIYPKPSLVSVAGTKLLAYTAQGEITVPFKVTGHATGPAVLAGSVNYQACNASSCYPPSSVSFSTTISIK